MDLPHIHRWQRIIQRLASIKIISTGFLSHNLHKIDNAVLNWTGGKKNLTQMLTGLPVVVITTTGAKTGKPRTIPLAGLPDGDKIILVPTHFGQHHYPGWYYNLRANPTAQLHQNGLVQEYTSRIANPVEWERYWKLAVHYYSGYQAYLERSGEREIPIFILEPAR
jgi:deazaflavin-dependent oxidoreductase (nitroreductase family)